MKHPLTVNILVSFPEILINRGNWGRSVKGGNVFEARNRSWRYMCYLSDVTFDPTKLPDYYEVEYDQLVSLE